jgi:phosphatidylglycerophosphatase C
LPDVAAFDFDGTLIRGGSVFDFLCTVAGRPAVLSASLALSPRLVGGALASGAAADRAKELLFERVLAGVSAERAEQLAADFAHRHLERRQRPDVRTRLDWHLRRGDRVAIVSASPELYVREAGADLGADQVIATRLARSGDGTLTGRYQGANCRGEEKLRRLRGWIESADMDGARLWAYGNSRGDLSMLSAADVGVNVGRLGRLGRLRAFPGFGETGPDRMTG